MPRVRQILTRSFHDAQLVASGIRSIANDTYKVDYGFIPSSAGSSFDDGYVLTDAPMSIVRKAAKMHKVELRATRRNPALTVLRRNPATGEIVEVYRGVPIRYRGGRYMPDIVSDIDGGNVAIPNLSTLAAARRFVGFALKRGAIARDKWRPSVTNAPKRRIVAKYNGVKITPRTRKRKNPAATRTAAVLSNRAVSLAYLHAESSKAYDSRKGQAYIHKFQRGVTVQLLSDGSVRLYRPDRKPLWKNHEE